jgi:hypothetical protein
MLLPHSPRSLSCETSYDVYEPSVSSPPSPSPILGDSRFTKAIRMQDSSLSSSEPLIEDNLEASRTLAMLTSLSLPGTPLSSGGQDAGSGTDAKTNAMSWTNSSTSPGFISPTSVISAYGQVQDGGQGIVSPFSSPLPSLSPAMNISPFTAPIGPPPSPTSELSSLDTSLAARFDRFNEGPSATSAAEYAAALMSFAWGSDSSDQVMSVGDAVGIVIASTEDGAIEDDFSNEEHSLRRAPVEYLSKGTSTRPGIVEIIKRFGGKMKRLLRRSSGKKWKKDPTLGRDLGRARGGGVTVDVNVDSNADRETRGAEVAALGILTNSALAQTHSSSLLEDLNPRFRPRRPRPSLNEHTYASVSGTVPDSSSPPQPNVNSSVHDDNEARACFSNLPSSSPQVDVKGKGKAHAPQPKPCENPENQTQTQAGPTQTQVRKSRRMSLSTITDIRATANVPCAPTKSRPLSSVVEMSRHAPLIENRSKAYRGPVNVEIDRLRRDVPILRTNGSSMGHAGVPPGLPLPPSSSRSMTESREPASLKARDKAEGAQNKTRRFSLSALSSLSGWKESSLVSSSNDGRRGSRRSMRAQT